MSNIIQFPIRLSSFPLRPILLSINREASDLEIWKQVEELERIAGSAGRNRGMLYSRDASQNSTTVVHPTFGDNAP